MTYNPITYTATGGQTVFNIPFDRLSDDYIFVATKLVGAADYITKSVSTDYTIVGNTIVFTIGLASGVKVRIWRKTNRSPLVDFTGVSNLTSSNLGLTTTQQSNIAEEVESDLDEANALLDGFVTSIVGYDPDNTSNTYLELQGDLTAAVNAYDAKTADVTTLMQNGTSPWSSTRTYVAGNMVTRSNNLWRCLIGNTNSIPADGNANWDKMLSVSTPPSANSVLPSQTGNAGKVLTTNGTNTSWASVPFASVNFDGTTAANVTGTFTRTGNTVTVNVTGHGHLVGHGIYLTSGVLIEWARVATVIDANSFTFTSATSGTIGSTACTLNRRSIRKANNVQSVVYGIGAGLYIVNMTTSAPDTNYVLSLTGSTEPPQHYNRALVISECSNIDDNGGARGVNRFAVFTSDNNTDTGDNPQIVTVAVFA